MDSQSYDPKQFRTDFSHHIHPVRLASGLLLNSFGDSQSPYHGKNTVDSCNTESRNRYTWAPHRPHRALPRKPAHIYGYFIQEQTAW